MRAMLWDNWRVPYAIVSDPAPEPDFHHLSRNGGDSKHAVAFAADFL